MRQELNSPLRGIETNGGRNWWTTRIEDGMDKEGMNVKDEKEERRKEEI